MSLTRIVMAIIAFFASATIAHANAITFTDVGQSFTVNYDGFADGQTIEGLSGQATFTLTGVDGNTYTFSYEITNTSGDPIDASRISIFGFDTSGTITSADSTGLFNQAATGNAPGGIGNVEICFKGAGGPNCAGGGGVGITIGQTAEGEITLTFSEPLDELTLSNLFVRYQSIEGGGAPDSAVGRGTPSSSTGGDVPAPGGMLIFAAGLAAIGWRVGRRKAA